jgi:hypothetical protein
LKNFCSPNRRDDARDDARVDRLPGEALHIEQRLQEHRVFVRRARRHGLDPPARRELRVAKHAEYRVRVADIDGEEDGHGICARW